MLLVESAAAVVSMALKLSTPQPVRGSLVSCNMANKTWTSVLPLHSVVQVSLVGEPAK